MTNANIGWSALFLAANTTLAVAHDDPDSRRAAVERGLQTATPVAGVAWTIEERMARHGVPGVAVAVIDDFAVDWVQGYGVRDAATGKPVTARTLFQAGSISKPVAAFAALKLVQDGKLALEGDVREHLRTFELKGDEFLRDRPLTLEDILSHRGGVTVHGFLGYHRFGPVPTLDQVLAGAPPANSPPIVIDSSPGRAFRYAGGGTTIMQRMMIDVSGTEFPQLVRESVFAPLGMADSTYEQPLPEDRFPDQCAGHLGDGAPTPGRWHVHPEMAAAGLWISAADLARFVIELQLSLRGESNRVLEQEWAERMVSPVGGGTAALGLFLERHDGTTWFGHGGTNVGFQNRFVADREGHGVVLLTNGDNGIPLFDEIERAVASAYGWEGFTAEPIATLPPDAADLDAAPGRYELADDQVLVVARDGDALTAEIPPAPRQRLHRVGDREYVADDGGARFDFDSPGEGGFEDAGVTGGNKRLFGSRLEGDERTALENLVAGAIEPAIADYRARHVADPADVVVADPRLNGVVLALARRRAFDSALALARLNVELHPESTNSWDTLGRVAFVAGDRKEAERAYETVLRLEPASESKGFGAMHRESATAGLAAARGEPPR